MVKFGIVEYTVGPLSLNLALSSEGVGIGALSGLKFGHICGFCQSSACRGDTDEALQQTANLSLIS